MTISHKNVRAARSPFFGRTAEIDSLLALVARGERLITITGTTGVGKSRVAAAALSAIGAQSSGTFTQLVQCDLAEAAAESEMITTVAGTLDAQIADSDQTTADQIERVARALASRGQLLLVLDNFDRLTNSATGVIERWLTLAPDLMVVVTSRERLKIDGEWVFELAPLDASDALALALDRITRVRGGFVATADDRRAIKDIVAKLDRLPLAIEWVMARARTASPSELLAQLTGSASLLRGDRLNDRGRQSSLRESLDASLCHLEPNERIALAQCAVFRGGFTFAACEGILDVGGNEGGSTVFDAIDGLRDRSILSVLDIDPETDPTDPHQRDPARSDPGPTRLGMYALVGEYASERLDVGDGGPPSVIRERHAAWFEREVQRLALARRTPTDTAGLHWLGRERENLHAAAAWSLESGEVDRGLRILVALDDRDWYGGHRAAFGALVDRALKQTEGDSRETTVRLAARVRMSRSRNRRRAGDLPGAISDAQRISDDAVRWSSAEIHGLACTAMGGVFGAEGRSQESLEQAERALEWFCAANDREGEARSLMNAGSACMALGRPQQAREALERATVIYRELGHANGEASAHGALGAVLMDLGHEDEALTLLHRALDVHRARMNRAHEAWTLASIALVRAVHDEAQQALADARRAVRIAADLGDLFHEGTYMAVVGVAHWLAGRNSEAHGCLESSQQMIRRSGHAQRAAFVDAHLAGIAVEAGLLEEATMRLRDVTENLKDERGPFAAVASVMHSALDRALAARAERAGDRVRAQEWTRSADEHWKSAIEHPAGRAAEVVLAARLAKRIQQQSAHGVTSVPPRPTRIADLTVHHLGEWFAFRDGARVSCRNRRSLKLVLARLVEQTSRSPGAQVARDDLIAAGWPDERLAPHVARNRLWVGLNALRKLGLRAAIISSAEGYMLDPALSIEIVEQ